MPVSKRHGCLFTLAGGFVLLLLVGVVYLIITRFERGDVYPDMSTLSSTQQGCAIWYESLRRAGVPVQRNFRELTRTHPPPGSALWMLGISTMDLQHPQLKTDAEWWKSARQITLMLVVKPESEAPSNQGIRPDPSRPSREKADSMVGPSLTEQFEVDWDFLKKPDKKPIKHATIWASRDPACPIANLPSTIPWRGSMYFIPKNSVWTPLYCLDTKPIIMSRPWQGGRILLFADTWFLSNEALTSERSAPWLAWLAGQGSPLLMDESHLGLKESRGVVSFGRQYGLQWLPLPVLLMFGLYLWRCMRPLPETRDTHDFPVAGTSGDGRGLTMLLERFVEVAALPQYCLEIWRRTSGSETSSNPMCQKELDELIAVFEQSPKREKHVLGWYRQSAAQMKAARLKRSF